jgi:hypothetical protein
MTLLDLTAEVALLRADYGVMAKQVEHAATMAQSMLTTNRELLAQIGERNRALEVTLLRLKDALERGG